MPNGLRLLDPVDPGPASKFLRVSSFQEVHPSFCPAYSTDSAACRGISVEAYRIAGRHKTVPFFYDDLSVGLFHAGTVHAEFDAGAVTHVFGPGGLAIIPPAIPIILDLLDVDYTLIYLKLGQLTPHELGKHGRLEVVPQVDPSDLQLTLLIACIREELQNGLPGGRLFMETLGTAVVTHVLTRYTVVPLPQAIIRGGLAPRQLRRAQDTMMAALDDNFSLAGLAQEAGLSLWHFSRAFKQSTGLSPHRWIRERRLERARQLLADKHRSLTSIALHLGFASLSHFSTAFKQATGLSPRRYRRRLFE